MSGMFGQVTPVQVPDFGASAARAQGIQANRLAMLAQQRQMANEDALQGWFAQHGAGFASADPQQQLNLLAQLASQPGGARMALPMMQTAREELEWRGGAQPAAAAPVIQPAAGGGDAPPGDPNLPRGIRNNNPLNLTYVAGQPGVQGSDGRFGRYGTPEEGIAAATRQLQMYGQRGLTTPAQIIGRWAPPGENNTGAYVAAVARRAGLDPNQPINLADPAVVSRLVGAMAHHENGRPIDDAVVRRGVQMALGGDTIPAQAGGSPGNDAAPASMPGQLPEVPGFDMALVRRAIQMPNNERARRYLQSYMQAAQLTARGEAQRPVEIADPTSPTGRRLVSPQQATGAPAPGGNMQTIDLGTDAPEGAGRYRVNPDGSMTRIGAIPPREAQAADPFNRANTLRDEYTRLTGDFRTVQTAYQNIQGAARSQNGAGDMSMLYSFVRMLDPTSVVRESEFATAAASGSYGERIQGAVQRILSGQRLADSLRESFLSEARTLFETQRRSYERAGRSYRDIATRNGLNPDDVVIPFEDQPPEAQPAAAQPTPAQPAPAAPGPGGVGTAEPPAPPRRMTYNPRTGRIE